MVSPNEMVMLLPAAVLPPATGKDNSRPLHQQPNANPYTIQNSQSPFTPPFSRATSRDHHSRPVKSAGKQGLSDVQLEKLPKITGKDLRLCTNDCAICLDVIGNEELARLIPGCNHGFHLECLDLWLSKQPFCPICRHKLQSNLESVWFS
ncbi:hypothetical protein HAX54_033634 [Datura stramonium]|uniref:RING-type domain-containing protein n=1 Tax=Datura stramonium TaxID=4076 RepID=A0ABS8VE04_DATST|nr:hypothetical protein [Datura stramonium]